MKASNAQAQSFKALHVPGRPLLLANIHDATSARVVGALPRCAALATASYSVALAAGATDDELDLPTQLAAVRAVAPVAAALGKPLTVDLQDGYGAQLASAVRAVIDLGAVGINLEDTLREPGGDSAAVADEATAVDRIRTAARAAREAGLPDFVINARSDTFMEGGTLEEAIRRGRAYLEAGATTVFIFGPQARPCTREEVEAMVRGLEGRVNVSLALPGPGKPAPELSAKDLAEIGIARVSVGPQLYFAAAEALKAAAGHLFES
ncbi:uncharacterized protein E0L32_006819 [Thyridium curvatum]|uniref:Uncharacterized protein n=1 Tax=Thyridium curvatum TaxID=1093900 RepID=A0A507AY24_9PEZI|nr:uncharacterized protein E0L32_006819 [Thyridium curvatum]TPX12407.1 hypothetical protein E0L32_006819 [Thyridium curvatum]